MSCSTPRLVLVLSALLAACAAPGGNRTLRALGASGPAPQVSSAVGGSFLAGAAAGLSTFHDYEGSPGDRVDDEDTPLVAFVGYQINPLFAVVLGYLDFGTLHAQGSGNGGYTDAIDYSGLSLMGLRLMPIDGQSAAFASAGLLFWNQEVDYLDGFGPFVADESGSSPSIGVGYDRYLNADRTLALHVAWNHFFEVGDFPATGHDSDIDMFTVGILLRR